MLLGKGKAGRWVKIGRDSWVRIELDLTDASSKPSETTASATMLAAPGVAFCPSSPRARSKGKKPEPQSRQRQYVRSTSTGPRREAKDLPDFWCRSIGLPHCGQSGGGSAASTRSSSDLYIAAPLECVTSRIAISMPSRSATSRPSRSFSSLGTRSAKPDRATASNAAREDTPCTDAETSRLRTSPPSSQYSVETPSRSQTILCVPETFPASAFSDPPHRDHGHPAHCRCRT